jgi:hypothetical protein
MSLIANIEHLHVCGGIEAVAVVSPNQPRSFRGNDQWCQVLDTALRLFALTSEPSIRMVVGNFTLLIQREGPEIVGIVLPTGHAIAKSLRRMIRRMARKNRSPVTQNQMVSKHQEAITHMNVPRPVISQGTPPMPMPMPMHMQGNSQMPMHMQGNAQMSMQNHGQMPMPGPGMRPPMPPQMSHGGMMGGPQPGPHSNPMGGHAPMPGVVGSPLSGMSGMSGLGNAMGGMPHPGMQGNKDPHAMQAQGQGLPNPMSSMSGQKPSPLPNSLANQMPTHLANPSHGDEDEEVESKDSHLHHY